MPITTVIAQTNTVVLGGDWTDQMVDAYVNYESQFYDHLETGEDIHGRYWYMTRWPTQGYNGFLTVVEQYVRREPALTSLPERDGQ